MKASPERKTTSKQFRHAARRRSNAIQGRHRKIKPVILSMTAPEAFVGASIAVTRVLPSGALQATLFADHGSYKAGTPFVVPAADVEGTVKRLIDFPRVADAFELLIIDNVPSQMITEYERLRRMMRERPLETSVEWAKTEIFLHDLRETKKGREKIDELCMGDPSTIKHPTYVAATLKHLFEEWLA